MALLSVAGVALMPGTRNRVHYLGPVSVVGAAFVAAAIMTVNLFNARGLKSLLVCVVLAVLNPLIAHAILRAERLRASRR